MSHVEFENVLYIGVQDCVNYSAVVIKMTALMVVKITAFP